MIKLIRLSISTALSLVAIQFAISSSSLSYAQSASSSVDQVSALNKPEKTVAESKSMATTDKNGPAISDPLVRVLISKGVLSEIEGRTISMSGTPSEQRDRLATLLRDKGLLSATEYEAVRTVAPSEEKMKALASSPGSAGPATTEAANKTQTPAAAPTVIAAVAPVAGQTLWLFQNEHHSRFIVTAGKRLPFAFACC